jgi:nucleotide-binding universal stress UspA family protein
MVMFERILVPIDFSPDAAKAWELACRLAGAETTLLALNVVTAVYPDVAYANVPAAMKEQQRDNERRLAAFVGGPAGHALRVKCSVTTGDPSAAIVATARDVHADLIVMAVHPRHGFGHWLRGSVTERVVHDAPCHVLVAKTTA